MSETVEIIAAENPQKIAKRNGAAVQATPMSLLEIAVNQGADVAKIEKLLDLQLRWEANEAKKAYVIAMKDFKSEVPQILKNRTVAFGEGQRSVSYSYATLDNACDQIIPALAKHGLIHKWRTQQSEAKIRVTCVMTHQDGHSEDESWLEASPDTSGSKNGIQAIGSAVSYLERYTLLAACGIAVKGQDSDALPQMAGIDGMLKAIIEAANLTALEQAYKEAFRRATEAKNFQSMKMIVEAKDNRKRELLKDEPAQ